MKEGDRREKDQGGGREKDTKTEQKDEEGRQEREGSWIRKEEREGEGTEE